MQLNIVTLEPELVPKRFCNANEELAKSRESWHPTNTKQNIVWMS